MSENVDERMTGCRDSRVSRRHGCHSRAAVVVRFMGMALTFCVLAGLTAGKAAAEESAVDNERCLAEFSPLVSSGDFKALSNAFQERPSADPCSAGLLEKIRERATEKVADRASMLVKQHKDPESALALITGKGDASFRMASVWQVNAVRGEIAMAKLDWVEASLQFETAYEMSLGSVSGALSARKPASEAMQENLYRLSSEAMQLAGGFGESINRGGEASGIFGTRGPKPRYKPTPLQFETESAELTTRSLEDIDKIVSFLVSRKITELEVIGHADWTGPDEFNLDLSKRRARTVSDAIQTQYRKVTGSTVTVNSRGVGEDCPRIISDISRYTKKQIAALYRRVSLSWSTEASTALKNCDEQGVRE